MPDIRRLSSWTSRPAASGKADGSRTAALNASQFTTNLEQAFGKFEDSTQIEHMILERIESGL